MLSHIFTAKTEVLAWVGQGYHVLRSVAFGVASVIAAGLPPRPGDTSVAAGWMTVVLQSQGVIPHGTVVATATLAGLSGGLAAATGVITVAYSEGADPTLPTKFVLKRSSPGVSGRRFCMQVNQYREAWFYGSWLKKRLPEERLPKIYYTSWSALLGEYVILMEFVPETRDVVNANLVFGNQTWGVPEDFVSPVEPRQLMRSIFRSAAEQHAVFWNDTSLFRESRLKGVATLLPKSPWWGAAAHDMWMSSARRGWAATKAKIAAGGHDVTYSDRLATVLDERLARTWEETRVEALSFPFSLNHGDFHASNMFAARDPATAPAAVVFFDWSEVGVANPVADLAQHLISDVKPELMAVAREELKLYWQRLAELGVDTSDGAFNFDKCWRAFYDGGLTRWAWLLGLLSAFPVPAALNQYLADQMHRFIELEPEPVA